MKVLFVSSGNSREFGIASFIREQGESLKKIGVEIEFFTISGKCIKGYLNTIRPLRKKIKSEQFEIIHAHYVLSGWVALLTFTGKPLIISYMGCDTYGDFNEKGNRIFSSYINIILAKLIQPFAHSIIVKSENLLDYIYLKRKSVIIPNGVNLIKFAPDKINNPKQYLKLNLENRHILFLGNPSDPRKNYGLLKNASKYLDTNNEILAPYPINQDLIPKYLNAADVVVLLSYAEGSPNIIKEAMSCNCPIVSTDVGDVRWVIANTEGCYITSYQPEDVAKAIQKALRFGKRTKGRERIKQLNLDIESVAQKIISVYNKVLNC